MDADAAATTFSAVRLLPTVDADGSSVEMYSDSGDLLFLMSFTAQQINPPLFASDLLFYDVKSL